MNSLENWTHRLLRRGERLFKLDMVYIAKGGFWTSFRFTVGLLTSVASMIAFGNLLPKEDYGVYSYLLSLAASLGFLTLSGIGPAVTRAVARGQRNILRYALSLQLRYNLLALVTIAAAGAYYFNKGNLVFALSLLILALVLPIESAFHIYEHFLIGHKKFDTLAILSSIFSIGAMAATVLTLLLTDNVLILIAVYAIVSFGPSFFTYKWIAKNLPKEEPPEEAVTELRHSAFHITGAGIIGTLANYLDKIILFQVAGPSSLAIYGFAIAGPERIKGLLKNWISIAMPRLSERNADEIHKHFYQRLGLAMIGGAAMASAYIMLSPFLFKWFLPKYLDSILYSQVYSLGLIVLPISIYVGNVFYSQNMLKAIYISSTGVQLLRISLLLFLGWRWQTWGLIAAWLSTQLISAAYVIYVWERERIRLKITG